MPGSRRGAAVLGALLASLAPACGHAQTAPAAPDASTPAAPRADSAVLFKATLDALGVYYVQQIDRGELTTVALKSMLASLDGHSTYMTPKEFTDFNEAMSGKISGIGVVLETAAGATRVVAPVDGGPAARAGIGAGWELTGVNGSSARGKTLPQVIQMLRGNAGEPVDVEFADLSGRAVTYHLIRELIQINSVYQRRIGEIGYLRITGFTRTTDAEFGTALDKLLKAGPVKGILLDMRNNSGGIVDTAVALASRFLQPGQVVVRSGKTADQSTATAASASGGTVPKVPVVIVINGGTASAAEIVSAALHDNGRARLVGLTSFGKGLVQTVFPINNGAEGAVSITTQRYYTPSGHSIQQVGIAPDLVVARSADEARDVVNDRQFSEARLPHALANEGGVSRQVLREVEAPPPTPAAPPPLFVHPLLSDSELAGDFQLVRALDLLNAQISGTVTTPHRGVIVRRDETVASKVAVTAGP
mgnify:CR=1 FL=1|jgi:carboxyl-terminal processing protease